MKKKKIEKFEGTLTVKQLNKVFNKVSKLEKKWGVLVGILGGIPVYANTKVPEGELWIKSEKQFSKIKIEDFYLTRRKGQKEYKLRGRLLEGGVIKNDYQRKNRRRTIKTKKGS